MKAAQSLLDERLRALSDPTRRAILHHVNRREMPASAVAARFAIARPTVSRHMRILETARLVTVRKHGTSRFYLMDEIAMQNMNIWFQTFWDEGLSRLKTLAETEEKCL